MVILTRQLRYIRECRHGNVQPGKMFVYHTNLTAPRFIINFPTKRHWKNPSLIEDINQGLDDLVTVLNAHNIRTVAVPALGCGLGGLPWETVRTLILAKLDGIPTETFLYGPVGS